ncbi:MAG TPA: hypothetical protein ENI98_12980, partial [Gammaproteobacteria bacterium]|nr:hypothetical protein [Gammaproteobacteria bacterium]
MQLTDDQLSYLGKVKNNSFSAEDIINFSPDLADNYFALPAGLIDSHPKAAFYLALAEMVDGQPGVEETIPIWLRGAAEVNQGIGSQSDFIRSYNADQALARNGVAITDAEMDAVSDLMADKVFDEIFEDPTHTVPSTATLAEKDAAAAAELLFGTDLGGWAGNPLFLFLGYDTAFNTNIINPASPNGTYDALAMIKFGWQHFGFSSLGDLVTVAYNYPGGVSTATAAGTRLNNFLKDSYSQSSFSSTVSVWSSNIILGQVNDGDVLVGSSGDDYIHGSGGSDDIIGSLGYDLVDGGTEADSISYEALSTQYGGVQIALHLWSETESNGPGQPFSGVILFPNASTDDRTWLYNIETVSLGNQDDVLMVSDISRVTEINGLDEGEGGDTADFSGLDASGGITFDLETGDLIVPGEGNHLNLLNFENVVGSSFDDTINGNDETNRIDGREGIDEIDGGAGNDIIQGGAGNDVIQGGLDRDIIFGGADNDNIQGFLEIDLSGGEGGPEGGGNAEAFSPHTLFDVIDGGEGSDTLSYDGSGEVRVGEINGELAFAISDIGATDIALNIETLDQFGSIDFSAYQEGITLEANSGLGPDAMDVNIGGNVFHLTNFGAFIGSNGADTLTASAEHNSLNGAGGDDVITGAGGGVLHGGNGGDTLIGAEGDSLYGGEGDDTLTSGGGGVTLSGGSGTDIISAQIGDTITGDANDTLTVAGVDISGDDVMFGIPPFYFVDVPAVEQFLNETLFSKEVVILVRPSLIQFGFDGTQASISWDGYIIRNPSRANFDDQGFLIEESADARIFFKIGDFGINTNGLQNDYYFDRSYITSDGERYYPSQLPVGEVTGTIIDDELTPPSSFEDYSGVTAADLQDYYTLRHDLGEGGGSTTPASAVEVASASGSTSISSFNTSNNYLIYDGNAVDPTDTGAGFTVSQVGANVEIDFGNGDVVTLQNTSLTDWQTAAATQSFGSAGDDVLTGAAQGETFVSGAGNDVINGASGDDTIVYTSGDDVITGHGTNNYGNDPLDLRKYTADQVSFRIVGHDVFIDTP